MKNIIVFEITWIFEKILDADLSLMLECAIRFVTSFSCLIALRTVLVTVAVNKDWTYEKTDNKALCYAKQ